MSDITIFPADIAEMSVSQLAALPPAQKAEIDKNLDAAIDWLKKARTKFDAALERHSDGRLEKPRLAHPLVKLRRPETCSSPPR